MVMVVGDRRRPVGFVLQLQLKQAQQKLTHGAMARLLGVDRSWWYKLRNGDVDPSISLAERAMRLWPGEFERFLPELVLARGPGAAQSPQGVCA